MKKPPLTALALFLLPASAFLTPAHAEVKLPALFSDHLVLQQETKAPVWGWAAPEEAVTVSVAGQTQSTKAGADGKWKLSLENLKAGGPFDLTVKGTNEITLHDVLVGEVWLGSGQSNMALTVSRAKDIEKEQAAANLPQIHMFTVSSGAANQPQEDCKGTWEVCSPATVGSFSAALYFFGREIYAQEKVPMGLIHSSVGGTPIESWINEDVQHADPQLSGFFDAIHKVKIVAPEVAKAKYEKDLAAWTELAQKARAEGKKAPRRPVDPITALKRKGDVGGLFNGKIAPLIPFAIRGALWYQGEANARADKAPFYQYQLPLLIKDWRARWGSEFPFAWVQLPNFKSPNHEGWCVVREAELKTLAVPHTGMAITLDVGEAGNIHPKDKQTVGYRLAQWALGTVYGKKVAISGPLPAGHEIRGQEVVLSFTHTDGGLKVKSADGALKEFIIAGQDQQWHPATAKIQGEKVIVSSPDVPQPAAVRYAWVENAEATLFNGVGLPASPFRTDDWPINFPEKVGKK